MREPTGEKQIPLPQSGNRDDNFFAPTLLIEDFEERHYKVKRAAPQEAVLELMRANGLKQKDLVGVFGTPSIVSEVLSGKRALSKEHIRRLSDRFHVSPEVFL